MRCIRFLVASLFAVTGVTTAHHSQSMFADTPVWVTGVIVAYRPVDPHVMIELQESQSGARAMKWIIEGPRMGRLEQILRMNGGIQADRILKIGDRISVCGFPLKKEFAPEQGQFVHGQVLVLPDGRMQSWGPYGVVDNCVRKGDVAQTWIGFLNRDALAHRQWCDAMGSTNAVHHTPRTLIDEIHRGLAAKCQ